MTALRRAVAPFTLALGLLGCSSGGGTTASPTSASSADSAIRPSATTTTSSEPRTIGELEDLLPSGEPIGQARPPALDFASTGEIPTLRPFDGLTARRDGERLAIAFLMTYLNVPEDMGSLIDAFGAPTLAPVVREYLVEDVRFQQLFRSDRNVPPGDIFWRVGEAGGQARLVVEVVSMLAFDFPRQPSLAQTSWQSFQVAVVQGPEGWAVEGLTIGPGADPGVVELTEKTKKQLLSGPGWTRIAS